MTRRMLRVAAAQYGIDKLADWDAYARKLDGIADAARAGGARLLVLPEYGAMELAALLPPAIRDDLAGQLEALQELHEPFVALNAALAEQHGLHIVATSFPVRHAGGFRNRAWLFGPDGRSGFQEKLQMTRFETERWGIGPGSELRVFDTPFGRVGIAICYDAEFPLIVRRQIEEGAEMILVPSCTDTLAGYHRVRIAAQARALENQCFVVQAPTVGEAPWSPAVDVNIGAASAFSPIDDAMAEDGVLALGELNRPGLVFADLDFDLLHKVRTDGEVLNAADWPRQAGIIAPPVRRMVV